MLNKLKKLIKIIVIFLIQEHIVVATSEAAELPAQLAVAAPSNYSFPGEAEGAPPNSIQISTKNASNSTYLSGVLIALIPEIDRPANAAALLNIARTGTVNAIIENAAATLSPNKTVAISALTASVSAANISLATEDFNKFNIVRTAVIFPRAEQPEDENLIFVPFPINSVPNNSTSPEKDADLNVLIPYIQKSYYNTKKYANLEKHVTDRHIGDEAKKDASTALSRFNAANIKGAMHYVRFVLNLISHGHLNLGIIQKCPNDVEAATHSLKPNVVYIANQDVHGSEARNLIIYYRFSYPIGKLRGSKTPESILKIIVSNRSNETAHGILANWHLKSAYCIPDVNEHR